MPRESEIKNIPQDSLCEVVLSFIGDKASEVTIIRQDDGNFTVKAAIPDEQGSPS